MRQCQAEKGSACLFCCVRLWLFTCRVELFFDVSIVITWWLLVRPSQPVARKVSKKSIIGKAFIAKRWRQRASLRPALNGRKALFYQKSSLQDTF